MRPSSYTVSRSNPSSRIGRLHSSSSNNSSFSTSQFNNGNNNFSQNLSLNLSINQNASLNNNSHFSQINSCSQVNRSLTTDPNPSNTIVLSKMTDDNNLAPFPSAYRSGNLSSTEKMNILCENWRVGVYFDVVGGSLIHHYFCLISVFGSASLSTSRPFFTFLIHEHLFVLVWGLTRLTQFSMRQ